MDRARFYIRFGHLPRGGKSKDYSPRTIYDVYGGERDRVHAGVSVFPATWSKAAQRWIIFENHGWSASLGEVWEQDRPMYLLTGRRANEEGADGEPLLIAKTIRKIKKLTKKDIFPGDQGSLYFYENEGRDVVKKLHHDPEIGMSLLRAAMTAELGSKSTAWCGMEMHHSDAGNVKRHIEAVRQAGKQSEADKWSEVLTKARGRNTVNASMDSHTRKLVAKALLKAASVLSGSALNKYRSLPQDEFKGSPLEQWGALNAYRLGDYWTIPEEVPMEDLADVKAVVQSKARLRSVEAAHAAGKELPPIELSVYPDGSAWVVDGNHRLAAARKLGLASVPVTFTFVGRAR